MRVLGITITETLTFVKQIDHGALRVLKANGLKGPKDFDIARATTVTRKLYANPAFDPGSYDRLREYDVVK